MLKLLPDKWCPACGGRLRANWRPVRLVWLGMPAGFAVRCVTCGALVVQRVRHPRSAITWPLVGLCFLVLSFTMAAIATSRSPGFILMFAVLFVVFWARAEKPGRSASGGGGEGPPKRML